MVTNLQESGTGAPHLLEEKRKYYDIANVQRKLGIMGRGSSTGLGILPTARVYSICFAISEISSSGSDPKRATPIARKAVMAGALKLTSTVSGLRSDTFQEGHTEVCTMLALCREANQK